MVNLGADPDHGWLIFEFVGIVTAEELLKAWRDMVDAPDFHPGRSAIIDMSAADRIDFSFPTVSAIDRLMRPVDALCVRQRTAVIAPRDDHFEVARLYAAVRSHSPRVFGLFRDREAAVAWLLSETPADTESAN